jgi:hydrogenase maturation protease
VDKTQLVLGIGNTLLGDDGVGIYIARRLKETLRRREAIDIKEATAIGGISVLDFIAGYSTVSIVDAIITKKGKPGDLYKLALEDLGTVIEPYMLHSFDIRSAIELGRQLGYQVPEAITLYAVEIEDNTFFKEGLSAEIEAAIPAVMQQIVNDLN